MNWSGSDILFLLWYLNVDVRYFGVFFLFVIEKNIVDNSGFIFMSFWVKGI